MNTYTFIFGSGLGIKSLEVNMESTANRLIRLRKKAKLSMKEVAEQIGVPISTYRDWEYGRSMKTNIYVKLSLVLKVSLSELLTGQKSQSSEILNHIEAIEKHIEDLRKSITPLF